MTENAALPLGWRSMKRWLGVAVERKLRALKNKGYERFLHLPPDALERDHCLSRAGAVKGARRAVRQLF